MGSEFSPPSTDRIHMDSKRLTDDALATMSEFLGFKSGIVPPLTFIQCRKKMLFAFEMFYVHRTIIAINNKK
jgi:hypothetical protein